MTSPDLPGRRALTEAISAAIVELYASSYGHHRTTATTYINDRVVVCVLESILTAAEDELIAAGAGGEVIDGRVAFQTETEDEFTVAIERLTGRRVVAFLSADQTTPGVAAELFILDGPPPRCGRLSPRGAPDGRRDDGADRALMARVARGTPSRSPASTTGSATAPTGSRGCCAPTRAGPRPRCRRPSSRSGDPAPPHPGGTGVAASILSIVGSSAVDVIRRATTDGAAGSEVGDVEAALARLPDAQREVIVLALGGELTYEEIADHLGLEGDTVKGRMRLGLERLGTAI